MNNNQFPAVYKQIKSEIDWMETWFSIFFIDDSLFLPIYQDDKPQTLD